MRNYFEELLRLAAAAGASDIHLSVGAPPATRKAGRLVNIGTEPITKEISVGIFDAYVKDDVLERFNDKSDVDFNISIEGVGRFRANVYSQRGSYSFAVRVIKNQIPKLPELNMPDILARWARQSHGLIIVTGPTGSGKSTTLAALIDLINEERAANIVTLEDPIEYLHRHKKSRVNQREIYTDALSFPSALRSALRQDPNVIMLGEMRDPETILTCLTAAETGHLVLTTLHTADAAMAINRIIDGVEAQYHEQVKTQLATVLIGVVAQRLLPKSDGTGLIAATEVMVGNPNVKGLIHGGKTKELSGAIETGGEYGMYLMKKSVEQLIKANVIDTQYMNLFNERGDLRAGSDFHSSLHHGRLGAEGGNNLRRF